MALLAPFSLGDTVTLQLPAKTTKLTTIDLIGGIKCHLCHIIFGNKKEFDSHYANHNTGSNNIVYTCVVCHKDIIGYPSFRNHCYLIHVVKDRFKCKECSKTFTKLSILQQHIDSVHKFMCASCKTEFTSKKELQMHQIIHKGDSPPYECQACQQPIPNADTCERHIDDHCTLTYTCPICNEPIPDKSETVEHLIKHFGQVTEDSIPDTDIEITEESSIDLLGGILCCFCDTTHKTRADFDMHFADQHSDKPIVYSCNICGKQYDKYNPFGDHCYYHYSKNRFECEECDKTFPRLSLLVLHSAAHAAGAPPWRCERCRRAFGCERRLRTHLRDAHAAPRLPCPEPGCPHAFSTPKELIYHQAAHKSGNRCQQCGLHFTSLAACERHVPVHRKKLYSCPVCTRSYAEKYLVMKHIQQHFSSVLHLCKICGKIFNAKHRLVQHVKVHSEVRNFKCDYCGKGFVKQYHLAQHLNIHTGLKPYQCTMCPKTFASYPNWHKHMRRMHNITKVPLEKTVRDSSEKDKMESKVHNNNNLIEEDFVDSTSSEMDNPFVGESDDSMVESDGIDPVAMEQESKILEAVANVDPGIHSLEHANMSSVEQVIANVPQFEILPEDNHDAFVAAVTTPLWPPREYGPDFGGAPGDDPLPHIDPLLTIKPPSDPYDLDLNLDLDHKWEPLISKLYSGPYYDTDARMSVINTDIY